MRKMISGDRVHISGVVCNNHGVTYGGGSNRRVLQDADSNGTVCCRLVLCRQVSLRSKGSWWMFFSEWWKKVSGHRLDQKVKGHSDPPSRISPGGLHHHLNKYGQRFKIFQTTAHHINSLLVINHFTKPAYHCCTKMHRHFSLTILLPYIHCNNQPY